MSPDSACSEGSAGSLEQQHDPDTDSLSQGSSVGSLCLEDDEDRNSLKNHFDTLASSLNDEKFETDLKTLQTPEEKHFLNPRLSISTRFLSRFQDRIKAWPCRAPPPPVSIPNRISEESNISNTSVNSDSSSDVASTDSTEKENGDVTSKTLEAHNSSLVSTVQQGAPRLGYLGTTASSRAKLSQESPTSTQDEEEKENLSSSSELQLPAGLELHSTKTDPHQDQTSRISPLSQKSLHHLPVASPQVSATPTEVMSLGEGGRWSVSSVEETNQTLVQSPALSITPTCTPPICDTISCLASRCEESSGGSETRIQTDPASDPSSSDLPTSSSSPLSETLRLPQTGDEESVSLLQSQQVANELRQTARRAVHLYQQLSVSVDSSEQRLQTSLVLREAFDAVASELQAVLQAGGGRGSSAPSGPLQDVRTMSLLERYSEQLVQMTQNKLNRI
ncbi:WD repeat-containing protein 62-like [Morone saxatilis]|uniref:WD repeat-containing protein 62-like n=1 Tax=Morone saxatilis TaxID=34816 RepID=UPI0015E20001|nr:WD repeat-containing protein 62-like [Morone saxatilis]